MLWDFDIFVNTGPYGGWKFQNTTPPTAFIHSEQNFVINKAVITECKVMGIYW